MGDFEPEKRLGSLQNWGARGAIPDAVSTSQTSSKASVLKLQQVTKPIKQRLNKSV
jgi:hypothetical protein